MSWAVSTCESVAEDPAPGNAQELCTFSCDPVATREQAMSPPLERRALLDELVSKGVRLTAQRRALIEVIQEAREHLDAGSFSNWPASGNRTSTVPRCIAPSICSRSCG